MQPDLLQVVNRMPDLPEQLWQTSDIKITESGTNSETNEPDTQQLARTLAWRAGFSSPKRFAGRDFV